MKGTKIWDMNPGRASIALMLTGAVLMTASCATNNGSPNIASDETPLTLEVEGTVPSATITYNTPDGEQATEEAVTSPWSKEITMKDFDVAQVSAYVDATSQGEVKCRIVHNGQVAIENSATADLSGTACTKMVSDLKG